MGREERGVADTGEGVLAVRGRRRIVAGRGLKYTPECSEVWGLGMMTEGATRRHATGADWLLGSRDVHVQRLHLLLLLLLQGLHGRHVVDDLQTAGQVPEGHGP